MAAKIYEVGTLLKRKTTGRKCIVKERFDSSAFLVVYLDKIKNYRDRYSETYWEHELKEKFKYISHSKLARKLYE